jgi:hypothetical protein
MKRASKVDANQTQVVSALRAAGASVQHLSNVGQGCPDLLVGHKGINYLMEVKDGRKSPSQRKLTDDQVMWHLAWLGAVKIVNSPDEALTVIGVLHDRSTP